MKLLREPKKSAASSLAGSRRQFLGTGLVASAALARPALIKAETPRVLYVNSQGGSWETAAKKNLFDPFTAKTGIQIKTSLGGSFAKLALEVRSGVYDFDIQTINGPSVVQAMDANLLEPINFKVFDRTGLPDNIIFENGVCNHAYATLLCFNTKKYGTGALKDWKDFWNVQRFPGSRSLGRTLSQTVVFALLADGVPRDKLYPIDLDRVFKSLDRIKSQIRVWWTIGPQIKQLMHDDEVDMCSIWHAHGISLRDSGSPVELVWNDFTMDRAYWVVSRGTPRADIAWEFLNFALQPKQNAGFCVDGVYGPVNPASFRYIAEKDAINMPTNPKYAAGAIEYDNQQMGAAMTPMLRRFEHWLL